MGTRHLIIVQTGGEYKVAQYSQWDGGPNWAGKTVLEFLRNEFDRKKFLAGLEKSFNPTDDQVDKWYQEAGAQPKAEWVGMDVGERFTKARPSLSRDTGSKILELIQTSKTPVPIRTGIEFAADSLFCEWAYVIDLDKNTFEIYKGFNKRKLAKTERFKFLEKQVKAGSKYQPVCLVKTYRLSRLPTLAGLIKACPND
jgi:hypothetical protein